MNKAFIFDLDGVLVNSEPVWEIEKKKIFTELLGEEKFSHLGPTLGLNLEIIYNKLVSLGAHISVEELRAIANEKAHRIYHRTPITEGIQELGKRLVNYQFQLGVVSASPLPWMELVINRLSFQKDISVVISLDERKDLAHKPSPAGYLEAIETLNASPQTTIILEDSNTGIAAAKASGAYVIGLKQNLIDGYIQEGADIYAEKVGDIMEIVKARETRTSKILPTR